MKPENPDAVAVAFFDAVQSCAKLAMIEEGRPPGADAVALALEFGAVEFASSIVDHSDESLTPQSAKVLVRIAALCLMAALFLDLDLECDDETAPA